MSYPRGSILIFLFFLLQSTVMSWSFLAILKVRFWYRDWVLSGTGFILKTLHQKSHKKSKRQFFLPFQSPNHVVQWIVFTVLGSLILCHSHWLFLTNAYLIQLMVSSIRKRNNALMSLMAGSFMFTIKPERFTVYQL